MSAIVRKLFSEAGDKDAVAIGNLCAKAKGSIASSVKYLIEAGQKLIEKKESLKHGEWLPWLKENADVLGFSSKLTAARLMKVANNKSIVNDTFDEAEAAKISKSIWGNTKPKSSNKPHKSPEVVAKHEKIVTLSDAGLSPKEIAAELGYGGKSPERTVHRVLEVEKARREAAPTITPDMLSMTAQEKLAAAIRQNKRELDAEHAARMHGLDEEVLQGVLKENKEYLATLKEMRDRAERDEKFYRELINDNKPLFTVEGFKVILMCLHPDGERTAEKLSHAFRLFNSKKLQLTGER